MDTAAVPDSAIASLSVFSDRQRMLAVIVLASVILLNVLDSTIVNVALPSISRGLHAGGSTLQWIVTGYVLSFAVLLTMGGRLGDVYGYRRMFIFGIAGFTAASLFCGLATTQAMLIGARLVQGAMAAMMAPQGWALVQLMYPPHQRGKIMGLFGGIGGAGGIAGPILGGLLVQSNIFGLSWRPVFLINAPVGLLAIFGGLAFLPKGRAPHPPRPDWLGACLLAVALVLFTYPLVQGRDLGWPAWCWAMLVASPFVLAGFWRYVRARAARDGSALVEPSLFFDRAFRVCSGIVLTFAAGTTGFILCWTLVLQLGLGFSPLKAGLFNIPVAAGVGVGIGLAVSGRLRRMKASILPIGAVIMGTGLLCCAWAASHLGDGSALWLVPGLLLNGFGMGLMIGPLNAVALGNIDPRHAGSASGTYNAMQQLGGTIGGATAGSVFFSALGPIMAAMGHRGQFTHAFTVSLGVDLALIATAALLVVALPRHLPAFETPAP